MAGCYSTGGARPDSGPTARLDLGAQSDEGVPFDFGASPDRGVPQLDLGPPAIDQGPPGADLGLRDCSSRSIDFVCPDRGNGGVPVNEAYDLPVFFGEPDDCFCGERVRCSATYQPSSGRLELVTDMCVDEGLCDGCFPFVEGTCRLPPLPEGTHPVYVNGTYAFDLEATDVVPFIPIDVCQGVADDVIGCGLEEESLPQDVVGGCFPRESVANEPAVIALDVCVPCGHVPGSCAVVESGGAMVVVPQTTPSLCRVGCPLDCTVASVVCPVPPLRPGSYAAIIPQGEADPTRVSWTAATSGIDLTPECLPTP